MANPSNMSHDFSKVPKAEIQRSSFDRSHSLKTTFNAGYLVPVFIDEVLPGDTFTSKMAAFGRLSTPLHPYMDNLRFNSFSFFVPNRLVWDNWQKFNGEQDKPGDSVDYTIPQIVSPVGGYTANSIYDYLGLPTLVGGLSHSALPLRALNLIWNDWFRDQNLQDSLVVATGDGPDLSTAYKLQRRGKRHDYFTSGLPWPQKGPAVQLPLGDSAPIIGMGKQDAAFLDGPQTVRESTGLTANYATSQKIGDAGATNIWYAEQDPDNAGWPRVRADLSDATAATINNLREAFQVQRLFERDARGGTRYTEIVRAHFGVVSPDARLQRPEYLGGGTTPINVNPVAQTSATDAAVSPQGNLAAIGTLQAQNHGFSKSFTEHGHIITLVSVQADLSYQQGMNRMWSRKTRFDFYWPALAHLGEQAILNKEIYAQGTADDEDVFAYQERWAEMRYYPSVICGEFRSNFAQTLDSWHLAQKFDDLPVLSSTFIEDNPPVERILAVPTSPHVILDCWFQMKTARPMPLYSVPGLIDHF